MDNRPLVSILIPCYNAERWVGQAIKSALAQTWPNKEVIVVDDGSTDGSRAVIESFGNTIRHEFGPNRGGNPCRNRLLGLATGEWVQFLDADDELLSGKINTQLTFVDKDTDAVYGGVTLEWWNDKEITKRENSPLQSEGSPIINWFNWQLAHTGAVIWRKEPLQKIGGWNERYNCCQDNEVCLRAIQMGFRFRQSYDVGSLYRIWSANSVSRINLKHLAHTKTKLLDNMLSWLEGSNQLKPEHMKIAGRACFSLARQLAGQHPNLAYEYARERSEKGLFDSTEAPFAFHLITRVFGYKVAEALAAKRRLLRMYTTCE
jgi:glycosyltransferase involved in cell wall biosynthesis